MTTHIGELDIQTTTYVTEYTGFLIDKVERYDGYTEWWIYNTNYGVKALMWGAYSNKIPSEQQIEEHICFYEEEYMN